jgi:hypothetical protein
VVVKKWVVLEKYLLKKECHLLRLLSRWHLLHPHRQKRSIRLHLLRSPEKIRVRLLEWKAWITT